jgi:hypothetical protein
MPTYRNSSNGGVLMLSTRFNPRSAVPRSCEIRPGQHFVTHSSEVPAHLLEGGGEEGPRVTLVSSSPTDEELFG